MSKFGFLVVNPGREDFKLLYSHNGDTSHTLYYEDYTCYLEDRSYWSLKTENKIIILIGFMLPGYKSLHIIGHVDFNKENLKNIKLAKELYNDPNCDKELKIKIYREPEKCVKIITQYLSS